MICQCRKDVYKRQALSWSLGSDRPDGTQTAYTLTLTDLDSRKVLYESGRVETAAQTATFPAGDFPAGALLHADLRCV